MTCPMPDNANTVTPHLVVNGAIEAIDFYKQAFNAEVLTMLPFPNDAKKLMHSAIKVGETIIFVSDAFGEFHNPVNLNACAVPMVLHFYVKDVDTSFNQAMKAGCHTVLSPTDMFWGDRYCRIVDPYGHHWALASKVNTPTQEEVMKGAAACFA